MTKESSDFIQPLKSGIKEILRKRVKTQEERGEFANFLKSYNLPHSDSHIQKLLYQEDYGGLEALIFSIYFTLGLSSPPTAEKVEDILLYLMKEYSLDEADRTWLSLPREKREYYSKIISFVSELDNSL